MDRIPKPLHGDLGRAKAYLLECKKSGTVTLSLVRGLVVGPPAAGKTTIMRYLEGWNQEGQLPPVCGPHDRRVALPRSPVVQLQM